MRQSRTGGFKAVDLDRSMRLDIEVHGRIRSGAGHDAMGCSRNGGIPQMSREVMLEVEIKPTRLCECVLGFGSCDLRLYWLGECCFTVGDDGNDMEIGLSLVYKLWSF